MGSRPGPHVPDPRWDTAVSVPDGMLALQLFVFSLIKDVLLILVKVLENLELTMVPGLVLCPKPRSPTSKLPSSGVCAKFRFLENKTTAGSVRLQL